MNTLVTIQKTRYNQSTSTTARSEGYRIRDLQEKPLSDASLQACKSAACIEPLAKATGAELIVGVALWLQKEKQMLQVAVSFEEPGGAHHSSSVDATEEEGALQSATEKAFRKTLATLSLGEERTLIIDGGPKGALVKLDGTDVGVLPYQGQIKPGTYTLTVTLKDHLPYTNQIHITSDAPEQHLKVTLQPDPDVPTDKASIWNWPIAGVLGAVGVFGVATFARTAINNGECRSSRDLTGFCDDEVKLSPWGYISLGVGIASLLGAGFFAIFQPIRVQLQSDGQTHAAIQLQGEF
ncbi:MAG: PEGA domain-containing protein [Myxococcales bacterium]|nr:MAG: PEGA domain-containing protein [Myxococcales bacterium]